MIAQSGNPCWPERGAPTLADIGIGLGRQPRWSCSVPTYYSVLAHSLAVASITPIQHRVYALLHDAHEAVLGDCPSTWKDAAREDIENRLQARIYASLQLPWPDREATQAVKRADLACLAAEAHILGHPEAEERWPFADVDAEAYLATTRQLTVCHAWIDAKRASSRLETAYRRVLREQSAASVLV